MLKVLFMVMLLRNLINLQVLWGTPQTPRVCGILFVRAIIHAQGVKQVKIWSKFGSPKTLSGSPTTLSGSPTTLSGSPTTLIIQHVSGEPLRNFISVITHQLGMVLQASRAAQYKYHRRPTRHSKVLIISLSVAFDVNGPRVKESSFK